MAQFSKPHQRKVHVGALRHLAVEHREVQARCRLHALEQRAKAKKHGARARPRQPRAQVLVQVLRNLRPWQQLDTTDPADHPHAHHAVLLRSRAARVRAVPRLHLPRIFRLGARRLALAHMLF
jgi:hypothetical protein